MSRQPIPFNQFTTKIFHLWDRQWFLLTSGDFSQGRYNTMTVSWGSLGIMWDKLFAQVVVRPVRHTYRFMEEFDTFTLSAFDPAHRPALNLLGSKSGRDGDKIAESGLTVCASTQVAAPAFEEAELVLECRKMYWHDYDPSHFLDPKIENMYPGKDYHRVYYGEILSILGTDKFKG